jgi:AraC family transcriptional regulator of adaptative response/methylated-DNA-[protein]-cysteine methyltransferase
METINLTSKPAEAGTDERWAALLARNPAPKGTFLYGVRTTGIFCRPDCRSRLPKRANVLFFDSAAEALAAGFRPCKRCQPDGNSYDCEIDGKINRACRLLENQENAVSLASVAKAVGMSPFHFHRLFKARLGLTPKQYQTTHRTNRFKTELRRQASVSGALYEAGLGSASRAYDQVTRTLGMKPRQYQRGGEGIEIAFGLTRTQLGWVLVAMTGKGVCAVELGENERALRTRLSATFPAATLREDTDALAGHLGKVAEYLAAPARGLSLPLDVRGTAFQRRVWEALKDIPAGKTASYGELAKRIGAGSAVRAVAGACAANRIALAIPCHRAVRADGGLGGYRWGLERKRALLAAERTNNKAGLLTRPD